LKVQERDKTETVAEEGFDYNMCGDEMEHIEKVESIEKKRAEKGDKISQLALFENAYKRVQHFQKLCKNGDNEEVQKNATIEELIEFMNFCKMHKDSVSLIRSEISKLHKKGNFEFEEIYMFFEFDNTSDLEISFHTFTTFYPELMGNKSLTELYANTRNSRVLMSTDNEGTLHINEKIIPHALKVFETTQKAIMEKKRISVSLAEEQVIYALWHEFLHNQSEILTKSYEPVDEELAIMETINELTARHTYTIFTDKLKIKASHQNSILKKGWGYQQEIENFRSLMQKLSVRETDFVKNIIDFNKIIGMESYLGETADRLLDKSKKNIPSGARENWRKKIITVLGEIKEETASFD
jgi:hypothetical protein